MVYYLTLHSCACICIVGASRMMRRSVSGKDHLHHLRGKRGREDGRNGAAASFRLRTTGVYRTSDASQATGSPGATGRPVPPEPPDVRCPADDRYLSAYSVRAEAHVSLSPLTYPLVALD